MHPHPDFLYAVNDSVSIITDFSNGIENDFVAVNLPFSVVSSARRMVQKMSDYILQYK